MSRQYFFAPIVLPCYNLHHGYEFTIGAASHKVAGMAAALRVSTGRPVIVSSPIVTSNDTRVLFDGFTCRDERLACAYLPAISVRGLNRAFAAWNYLLFALRRIRSGDIIVLYNYFPEYIPVAAWLCWRLGRDRVILDIEDGPRVDERNVRGFVNRMSWKILSRLSSPRSIVVSRQLADALELDDVLVVNGVCATAAPRVRAFGQPVRILYGGSIQPETGLDLFTGAVRMFADRHPDLVSRIHFLVTGFGGRSELDALARDVGRVGVRMDIMQDLGAGEYRKMLELADVGLALKMPDNALAATTFPSKVVELASHGLLVVTTDVSDVGTLFDDSTAVVLRRATADELALKIAEIARDPDVFHAVARAGQLAIDEHCGRRQVGVKLLGFLQGGKRDVVGASNRSSAASVTAVSSPSSPARQNLLSRAFGAIRFPVANAMLEILPATRMFGVKRQVLRMLGFEVAQGCRIAGGVKFYGKGTVTFGADTWIGLECRFIVAPDAPIKIGARCDIAPQVMLHTGSHEIDGALRRAGTGYSRPITVGDGSWIGARSTVCGGVSIGAGSIVAACAGVLAADYPDNVMLAGLPAVVKRELK